MSVRLMSAAFSANLPDVEIKQSGDDVHTVKASTSKFVLLALADHANDEGRGAYPSLETLAKKTSMTRRTVQRAIDALIQLRIIKCVGVSEYGTDNYSIFEAAIYGGDSGTKSTEGMTLGQEGDDSGALKSVPESPESSFKPSVKSIKHTQQPPNFEVLTVREAQGIKELQIFERATGYFPGSPLWETIYNDIRANHWTVDQLKAPWVEWCKRGYNQKSLSWMEWINKPIPEQNHKTPSTPKYSRPRSGYEQMKEIIAEEALHGSAV
jgi:hypothetical protein